MRLWTALGAATVAVMAMQMTNVNVLSGATLPNTCGLGAMFVRTGDAQVFVCASVNTWAQVGGASIPSGSILLVDTGTCPASFAEVSGLSGRTLMGTVAANGNVGGTGGADGITPVGTNGAPALTMNSYTPAGTSSGADVSAHSGANVTSLFTGAALGTHAHELPYQIPSTTTIRQIAVATFGTGTSRAATAVSAAGTGNTTSAAVALSQAISAGTPAGTIANTITQPIAHTVTQPTFSGTPATLTGSVAAPSFTGTSFDNRSAFTRVIFCKKT